MAVADSAALSPDPADGPLPTASSPAEVIDRYVAASRLQQDRLHDSTMQVELDGRLTRNNKEGSVRALREISPTGQIKYETISSSGDGMVRKNVLAEYMNAEMEASASVATADGKLKSIAITPDNYKFKYKGLGKLNDRQVYIFQLIPKEKRLGLFKGEIWVDAETFQSLRESGTFVKNPKPLFLSKVAFVRQYEVQDGFALPSRVLSKIETRPGFRAEVDVRFSSFSNPLTAQSRFCPLGW